MRIQGSGVGAVFYGPEGLGFRVQGSGVGAVLYGSGLRILFGLRLRGFTLARTVEMLQAMSSRHKVAFLPLTRC